MNYEASLAHPARLSMMTAGALLAALAVDFLVDDVVTGGITGGAMLLHTFFGTPIGLLTLLVNIPLFVIGFRSLGGLVLAFARCTPRCVMSLAIDG